MLGILIGVQIALINRKVLFHRSVSRLHGVTELESLDEPINVKFKPIVPTAKTEGELAVICHNEAL